MATGAAKRYARAIFELAQESNDRERWQKRVEEVAAALRDERTRVLLEDPSIPVETRVEALAAAAKGWDQAARNLGRLLIEAHRVDIAGELADEYGALVDEAEGRVRATVTTAVELPARERKELAEQLSNRLGREVRLDVHVDPSIIGGLVVRFGDHVVDASLASRLQQLRRQLISA